MKKITRTIQTTMVTVLTKEGQAESFTLNGDVGMLAANKEAEKIFPESKVAALDPQEHEYEISVEDFLKYAKVVEPKADKQ